MKGTRCLTPVMALAGATAVAAAAVTPDGAHPRPQCVCILSLYYPSHIGFGKISHWLLSMYPPCPHTDKVFTDSPLIVQGSLQGP